MALIVKSCARSFLLHKISFFSAKAVKLKFLTCSDSCLLFLLTAVDVLVVKTGRGQENSLRKQWEIYYYFFMFMLENEMFYVANLFQEIQIKKNYVYESLIDKVVESWLPYYILIRETMDVFRTSSFEIIFGSFCG